MLFLIIANIFSLISAGFTMASGWTKDPHRTYYYQVGQCLWYAGAAYFFGVYASILMMLINALRNWLVGAQKYSRTWMIVCAVSALLLGLYVNDGSIPGYISVIMTVYYTVSSFFLTEAKAVKVNQAIDMSMWVVYDVLVVDIPSGIMDFVCIVLSMTALVRILRDERAAAAEKAGACREEEAHGQ